jgi:hypothetical protein
MAITADSIKTIFDQKTNQFFIEDNIDYNTEYPASIGSQKVIMYDTISVSGTNVSSFLLGENLFVSGGSNFTGVFVGYDLGNNTAYIRKTSVSNPLAAEDITGESSGGIFTVGGAPNVTQYTDPVDISVSIDIDGVSFYTGSLSNHNFETLIGSDTSITISPVSLPLSSSNKIIEGDYEVTYSLKIPVFDTALGIPTFENVTTPTKTFTYENKLDALELCLNSSHNCYAPYITATESTDYSIATISPDEITRTLTLHYPETSNVADYIVTETTSTNILTSTTDVLWSGASQYTLTSDLAYDFTDYIHWREISTSTSENVSCTSLCGISDCIKELKSKVDTAKGVNQTNFNRLESKYNEVMTKVKHYEYALTCEDYDLASELMVEIKSILNCNCIDDCSGSQSKRIYGVNQAGESSLTVDKDGTDYTNISELLIGSGLQVANYNGSNIEIYAEVTQSKLDAVEVKADAAQDTADTAESKADTAQSAADSASMAAGVASVAALAAQNTADQNTTNAGNLSGLNTVDKTTLVAAINEVLASIGGGLLQSRVIPITPAQFASLGSSGTLDLGWTTDSETHVVSVILSVDRGDTLTINSGTVKMAFILTDVSNSISTSLYGESPFLYDSSGVYGSLDIYDNASFNFVRTSEPYNTIDSKAALVTDGVVWEVENIQDLRLTIFYVEL